MSDETVSATPETIETPNNEQVVVTQENTAPITEPVKEERTFTQSELDDIITKRIDRERESTAKRVAQESRDAYIAEQGYTFNGQPIKTEAEYKQAMKEVEIRKEYEDQDLPEEVLNEIVEGKKFREKYETKEQQEKAKEKQTNDFKAFFDAYPDLDANTVPASVWVDYAAGKDLVDSYAKHENAALKQKLAEIEKQKQVEQQNKENAEAATGSVVGQGSAVVANFTREQVAAMSKEEMKANYPAVIASMKAWKK